MLYLYQSHRKPFDELNCTHCLSPFTGGIYQHAYVKMKTRSRTAAPSFVCVYTNAVGDNIDLTWRTR